jgi:exopolysaccharide biosynthesis polyprenyl glycosylphosphotransferase
MFHQRIQGTYSLVILCQLLLSWLLFILLISVHRYAAPLLMLNPLILQPYPAYCLVVSLGFILASIRHNNESFSIFTRRLVEILRFSYRQWLASLLFLLVFLFLNNDRSISRVYAVTFFTCWFVLLVCSWKILPSILARWSFSGKRKNSVLFYGSLAQSTKILPWVQRKHHIGFHVLGGIRDEPATVATSDLIPLLGSTAELDQVITKHAPDLLMLVEYPHLRKELQNLIRVTEKHGVRLLIHTDWQDTLGRSLTSIADEQHQFLYFRPEPLENSFNRFIKRTLDICISICAVTTLLPLSACVIYIIQRCNAPGPLFFFQIRSGMNQKPFKMIKFRTMFNGAPNGALQTSLPDSRIYPGGALLRRFSIDEIPQFLNVLKGDMSIIGPRAHLDAHNQDFARHAKNYHVRKLALPGITGLAQIRGHRGEIKNSRDILCRLNSDIEYIENWSISLDFWILFKTGCHVILPPDRAY